MLRSLTIVVALLLSMWPAMAHADSIVLWHAYRGNERAALEQLVSTWTQRGGAEVKLLAVPYDAYAAKLGAAIPLGDGPDLFIDAHERLGSFVERSLVAPVADAMTDERAFTDSAVDAVTIDGAAYALPLSQKCLALYYRTDLVAQPPKTLERMGDALRAPLGAGSFLLAYETRLVYPHAAFLHGFGGRLLDADDGFGFVGHEAEASLTFVKRLIDAGTVPGDADGALVTRLFASGKAAFAINGPWLAAELDARSVPYRVAVLPMLDETGRALAPLLTVESLMMSPDGAKREQVRALARHLASAQSATERMRVARTVSARRDVHPPADDTFLQVFSAQAERAVPMPSSVAMRAVWEPAEKALRKVMQGHVAPREALLEAKRRFDDVRRPLPPPASRTPAMLIIGALCLAGAWMLLKRAREASFRVELRASLPAYRWVVHAVVAVGLLVFVPLAAGATIALYAGPPGGQYYVGIANFVEILTARGGPLLASGSFYLVLLVTVLWTLLNVTLHLGIGLVLGVLLSRPTMRLRALYRVLLILPWAVPNYVTALAWKGMFHRQFGAVRALTDTLGGALGLELEPIAWFAQFSTAFTANLATNVWLGFPFMMVVAIAALTAVPRDVLEAAEVDGATRFQRFWKVTLPMVRPSLLPAVVLGAIWTFNMFNVVFLVSGGEPDGQTDILVTEAYRWAFTRQAQYGYAAAYSVLIFLLLFSATRVPVWFKRRRVVQVPA